MATTYALADWRTPALNAGLDLSRISREPGFIKVGSDGRLSFSHKWDGDVVLSIWKDETGHYIVYPATFDGRSWVPTSNRCHAWDGKNWVPISGNQLYRCSPGTTLAVEGSVFELAKDRPAYTAPHGPQWPGYDTQGYPPPNRGYSGMQETPQHPLGKSNAPNYGQASNATPSVHEGAGRIAVDPSTLRVAEKAERLPDSGSSVRVISEQNFTLRSLAAYDENGSPVATLRFYYVPNSHELRVSRMDTLPWYRGNGIGTRLIAEALQQCPDARAISAELHDVNQQVYNQSIQSGLSPIEALRKTPWYKSASKLGFTELDSSSNLNLGKCEVKLNRPQR